MSRTTPLRLFRNYVSNLKLSNNQESLNSKGPKLNREERKKLNRERSKQKVVDRNFTIIEVENVKTDQAEIFKKDDSTLEVINLQSFKITNELLEFLKRSSKRKYKHRKFFKNPDGSDIKSKT